MTSKHLVAYVWDENGYLKATTLWQWNGIEHLVAPNSTTECPWGEGEPDPSVFYRFVDGHWTTEKKPTCAKDLVGVVVSHTSTNPHDVELRNLVRTFAQSEGFREKRGEDLSWEVEKIPEKTEEEKLADAEAQARAKRDALLASCDYFVMADYPASDEDKALVVAYRQALRDVPQQDGFPLSIVWPEKPACL